MHNVVLFGQCLGDPLTIRIIALLREGELCICEIQSVLQQDRGVVDLRLKKLRDSGIVRTRRRKQWLAYRIHTRFVDLVETVFEAFDDTIGWDKEITDDSKFLAAQLRKRVDDWCASPKGKANLAAVELEASILSVVDGGCCSDEDEPTSRWRGLMPSGRRWLNRRQQYCQKRIS